MATLYRPVFSNIIVMKTLQLHDSINIIFFKLSMCFENVLEKVIYFLSTLSV